MEKKEIFISLAIALVIGLVFARDTAKLGMFLAMWGALSTMLVFHWSKSRMIQS